MPSYTEGREARRAGLPIDACPYQAGPMRANWLEGWNDSNAMLKALGL